MSEVWKFPLYLVDEQILMMPEGAELLHVAEQRGLLCLWARVIPTEQRVANRRILIRGTGSPLSRQPYVGTVLVDEFVWHVFDGGDGSL
jgi:hypothetical protein